MAVGAYLQYCNSSRLKGENTAAQGNALGSLVMHGSG